MVEIVGVDSNSRAEKHGIMPGDVLLSVNGHEICDVLDYRFYLAEREIILSLRRRGEPFSVLIRKKEYDDIGLEFATPLMDKKHTCENKCIFCFIDQGRRFTSVFSPRELYYAYQSEAFRYSAYYKYAHFSR